MLGKILHGLGAACVRLRWLVVGVWIVAAVGITLIVGQVGAVTNNNLTLRGADGQIAYDVLEQYFPPQQNGSSQVVFNVTTGGRLSSRTRMESGTGRISGCGPDTHDRRNRQGNR